MHIPEFLEIDRRERRRHLLAIAGASLAIASVLSLSILLVTHG